MFWQYAAIINLYLTKKSLRKHLYQLKMLLSLIQVEHCYIIMTTIVFKLWIA